MNDVWGRPGGGAPMMKLKDQIISPRKHSGKFYFSSQRLGFIPAVVVVVGSHLKKIV